jgi:hypothetical protein
VTVAGSDWIKAFIAAAAAFNNHFADSDPSAEFVPCLCVCVWCDAARPLLATLAVKAAKEEGRQGQSGAGCFSAGSPDSS